MRDLVVDLADVGVRELVGRGRRRRLQDVRVARRERRIGDLDGAEIGPFLAELLRVGQPEPGIRVVVVDQPVAFGLLTVDIGQDTRVDLSVEPKRTAVLEGLLDLRQVLLPKRRSSKLSLKNLN